ncbi:hypothetical protein GNI_062480 [Gregarina niphandrodes]|uniref:Uncharacterized protein n=1 Tax=Gregarina niphandrodes TaxID=110365 RepID=A0A023B8C0_GRENI|nr:hypothetical protein GNI_062480 [Gregarina niphandrodes]EZG68347.1 hypothetical protein GNI_062480 [Gregarina niphandrodes]|eukprot:XP_011134584.1 hypothetical protein GNI_062480 [Gregarina niphandrodes]
MRCSCSGTGGETGALLAKVTLTCEFDGNVVDMVDAFEPIEAWDTATDMMQAGFQYLQEAPDLAIGLPAEEHVVPLDEELEAVRNEYRANDTIRTFIFITLAECLHAMSQVIEEHPETCGVSEDLGERICEWVDTYRNSFPDETASKLLIFPSTKATRIQDLKFILLYLSRIPGITEGLKTITIPTLQQCNLDEISAEPWHEAAAVLDDQNESICDPENDIALQCQGTMLWDTYQQTLGELAVKYAVGPR